MNLLLEIRKNGISDVLIFHVLNFLSDKDKNKNLLDIIGIEFFKIVFYVTLFLFCLIKKQNFSFSVFFQYISFIFLNFYLFLDKQMLYPEIDKLLEFSSFVSLFIIIVSKFRK